MYEITHKVIVEELKVEKEFKESLTASSSFDPTQLSFIPRIAPVFYFTVTSSV